MTQTAKPATRTSAPAEPPEAVLALAVALAVARSLRAARALSMGPVPQGIATSPTSPR